MPKTGSQFSFNFEKYYFLSTSRVQYSRFSLKTIERSAREKKSANTRGAERTQVSAGRACDPSYSSISRSLQTFRSKTALFHGPTKNTTVFQSRAPFSVQDHCSLLNKGRENFHIFRTKLKDVVVNASSLWMKLR